MEILKMIALLLGAVIVLSACSSGGEEPLGYQNGAFETEILITSNGMTVRAIFTAEAPRSVQSEATSGAEEEMSGRNVKITFADPPSLRGITASRQDGKVSVLFDGTEITDAGVIGWLDVADLFSISGNVTDTDVREIYGKKVNYLEVENGEDIYKIYLSPDSGYPEYICGTVRGRALEVRVVRFITG